MEAEEDEQQSNVLSTKCLNFHNSKYNVTKLLSAMEAAKETIYLTITLP